MLIPALLALAAAQAAAVPAPPMPALPPPAAPLPPVYSPPPPPPPPRYREPARSGAALATYFGSADYPREALRNREEGTVGFRLTVGANGRVTGCVITSSSGSAALDRATCRILQSRPRFTPAIDRSGRPMADTFAGRIRWVLPRAPPPAPPPKPDTWPAPSR